MTAPDTRSPRATYRLFVDGNLFTLAEPRLVSLTLTEKRGGEADQLDVVLDDTDRKLVLPRKGVEMKLELGWEAGRGAGRGLVDKGRFTVDQVEWGGPPDLVTIRARSADLTASFRTRREKSHRDTTLGAIAREVAKRHGYEARIAPELADVPVPILAQHQQSDMALLRRLGRKHDAVAQIKDRKLILSPIGRGTTTGGRTLPMLELTRTDVADYRYSEIERSADAGVEARWHDQDAGERKTVKAGEGKGTPRRLRKVYHSEAEAKAAAEAEARRSKRAEASFDVTLSVGRPEIVPDQPTRVHGFKGAIDDRRWLIAELAHTLDGTGGMATKLKLETGDL